MPRKPIEGVNLGGWLVLEKWITPKLFEGTKAVDEYTFCQQAGKVKLLKLQKFRDSFITQADFEWLAEQGIEAVRLPVGYWMFGNAAPYQPTVEYVDKVFTWAKETGIKILLDVHGAKGSQNGYDHSGCAGQVGWHHDEANITNTLDFVRKLAERYVNLPALLGISLLNEPSSLIPKDVLLDYYTQAYNIIHESSDDVLVVYSDGYKPSRWRKELPADNFAGLAIDTHRYQLFSAIDKVLPPWLNVLQARLLLPLQLRRLQRYHPIIVGEWSLALDAGTLQKLDSTQRDALAKRYAAAQLKAFQSTDAWFYWTYKIENGGLWSFRDCISRDLLFNIKI